MNQLPKKQRSRMSNSILQSIRDAAMRSGDHSKVLIADQLQQAYNTIDSLKSSYSAMVSASNRLSVNLREKDDIIASLQEQNRQLTETINSMIVSWKSIYELSIYGNSMFNSLPLINLWIYVDRFFASTNEDGMRANSLALMDAASKLNNDKLFLDMRNRLTTFSAHYHQNFGDVISSVESNNEPVNQESENQNIILEKQDQEKVLKPKMAPDINDLLTDYSKILPEETNEDCIPEDIGDK